MIKILTPSCEDLSTSIPLLTLTQYRNINTRWARAKSLFINKLLTMTLSNIEKFHYCFKRLLPKGTGKLINPRFHKGIDWVIWIIMLNDWLHCWVYSGTRNWIVWWKEKKAILLPKEMTVSNSSFSSSKS